ncbi:MAG TPA: 16S rRNA (cytosine(1402)-N(4))-methyltransferase RsmH [Mariprofundaceae bacterium]|nr:16S rRNA (cytosine(1402)-N(4))-methyltransferase RsmH [Mariprofundaceae bacterium]
MAAHEHIPILLETFVDYLCVRPDGCYVDATFGRGGHARTLLSHLSADGRLLGLDRDPQAVAAGEVLAVEDQRFRIMHASFAEMADALDEMEWQKVQGIGFDLGVSSPQLDDLSRGFSFRGAGPLDMRMDPSRGRSLGERLRDVSEHELVGIIRTYGGERYAGRIARAILRACREGALVTTADLENVCFHAVPKHARYGTTHPATRTFQALRMWVNDEMAELETGIRTAVERLSAGGRLVVISFHSGEDRRVRDLIEAQVNPCVCPPDFPVCACGRTATMRWVQKKPLRSDTEEVARNPRSRSARLRVAERI